MKNEEKIYGKELVLDLYHCREEVLLSKEKIEEFLDKICSQIKMKKYGKPIIERFGLAKDFTAGYSFVQLIETSSITGHLSEFWRRAYINIFSCGDFDEEKAHQFAKKFFGAKKSKKRVLVR